MSDDPKSLVGNIAEVKWIDTHTEHGWTSKTPRPGEIRSVGYVICDDDECITLSESIDFIPDASRYGCSTSIPKIATTSVEYIRGGLK